MSSFEGRLIWVLKDLAWKNGKGEYCWCEMRIGHPNLKTHTAECLSAQKILQDYQSMR